MEKLWYIKIRGKQQGPYSIPQLKRHREVTPDTLVWQAELSAWVPMRKVAELAEVFKDPEEPKDQEDEENLTNEKKKLTNELVLELQTDPPPILLWLCAALAIIALFIWKLLNDA